MTRRLTLPQLKKYDVTQKVIETLADSESRAILFSMIFVELEIVPCSKSIEQEYNPVV